VHGRWPPQLGRNPVKDERPASVFSLGDVPSSIDKLRKPGVRDRGGIHPEGRSSPRGRVLFAICGVSVAARISYQECPELRELAERLPVGVIAEETGMADDRMVPGGAQVPASSPDRVSSLVIDYLRSQRVVRQAYRDCE